MLEGAAGASGGLHLGVFDPFDPMRGWLTARGEAMRHFIRHPTDIPVEVTAGEGPVHATPRTCNVSYGGLAMRWERELEPGAVVTIRIRLVRPAFETKARVVWCRPLDTAFELGVEFLSPEDQFRGRMVQQVCRIHAYRQRISITEGRRLSEEEAAAEWIARYASEFPDPEPTSH
jgi:hypothetical protein